MEADKGREGRRPERGGGAINKIGAHLNEIAELKSRLLPVVALMECVTGVNPALTNALLKKEAADAVRLMRALIDEVFENIACIDELFTQEQRE